MRTNQRQPWVPVETFRSSLATSLIFATIGFIICAPGVYATCIGQWRGVAFILVGGAMTVMPLCHYLISWDERMLLYRGLVTTQKIQFSEIDSFEVHGPKLDNRFGPTLGLSILSKSSKKPAMTINIKPFARRDIARLIKKLKETTG